MSRIRILLAALFLPLAASGAQSPAPPPHPCQTSPEAHQFDFWVGRWDVTPWQAPHPTAAQRLGTNEVQLLLEHCVLLENWVGAKGVQGKSWNYYDTNVRHWRQVWVSETGGSLDYTGDYRDGAMHFQGWTLDARGNRVEQRLTFFAISRDTVRQLFEQSTDAGGTWTPGFDGRYVRR